MLLKTTIMTALLLTGSPEEATTNEQPKNDLDLNNDVVRISKQNNWFHFKKMANIFEKHKLTKVIDRKIYEEEKSKAKELKQQADERKRKLAEEKKRAKEEEKKKEEIKVNNTITVQASSYTYCQQDSYTSCKWGNNTATGKPVKFGYVAVDPSFIPLGTKMKIEGFGDTIFVAEDTGSAIKGNRLDVFLPSKKEALKFGRKKIKIYLLN